MKKLYSKQLRTIRIITIIIGMLISFVIWLFLPNVINNNALFHVGNGRYGSKIGALLIMLIPLFGFIPARIAEEIHSEDLMEVLNYRKSLTKEQKKFSLLLRFFVV